MEAEKHDGIYSIFVIGIAVLIIGGLFIGLVSYSDGYEEGIRDARYEAVKAGAAEWTFDESGRPTFKWNESE